MNMHVAAPGTPQDSRARNLATQERRRLKALQRLSRLRREAIDQIDRLIQFLDQTDQYAQHELEVNEDDSRQEEADMEPTLGAADRIINQDRAWSSSRWAANQMDGELDDCDAEDSDPAEESEHSGCGDLDGMAEQYGGHYASNGEVQ
ncbi:hypothetical protein [Tardiphaga sp. 709]|uniref:hypothetical protein n=1 Tax=Tardiphaga sp. 709 TaxID=3076039 RepID=UPI0028EED256|nr:hypothetical protein [Tardiphaga sp. 709]WNV10162.1 hypothetical protein RSO67_02915 [Tardiphaga sp. 709]